MTTMTEPVTKTKLRMNTKTEALRDLVEQASLLAKERSPKPVLACVLIEAADNAIVVSATDLERSCSLRTNLVQVESIGTVLVNAESLSDALRHIADDTVSIEETEGHLILRTSSSTSKLYHLNPRDFPPVLTDEQDGEVAFELSGAKLAEAIRSVEWATDKKESRYANDAILFTHRKGKLVMGATEGHVLCMSPIDVAVSDKKLNATIFESTANTVAKMFADCDSVSVHFTENQATFRAADRAFRTNRPERTFAPWEDVIPSRENANVVVKLAREYFRQAVRQASAFTTEETKGIRLEFSKTGIVLSSRSPTKGECDVRVMCKVDGKDLAIGFNPKFLSDILNAAPGDEIEICLTEPNRPGLFNGADGWQTVICAVNLQ